jgi:hypothetical protein
MKRDGYRVVAISEQQKAKLQDQAAAGGPEVRTLEVYVSEYNSSFEYRFVEPEDLDANERAVFDRTADLLQLIGPTDRTPPLRISETLRLSAVDTEGVWDVQRQEIVIKRSALSSLRSYASTLLHEVAHALEGHPDVTREFEIDLSVYLGQVSVAAVGEATLSVTGVANEEPQ